MCLKFKSVREKKQNFIKPREGRKERRIDNKDNTK